MIDPLYRDRISHMYAILDTNGSGTVTEDDFTQVTHRILDTFGHAPDSPEATRATTTAKAFWSALSTAVDTDRDGVLTKEEYTRASEQLLLDGEGPVAQQAESWVESFVVVADTDGNGILDRAEFTRLMRAFGSPEDGIELILQHMVSADGTVSVDKVRAAFVHAYTGREEVHKTPALAG